MRRRALPSERRPTGGHPHPAQGLLRADRAVDRLLPARRRSNHRRRGPAARRRDRGAADRVERIQGGLAMAIVLKSEREIVVMREAGKIVAEVLGTIRDRLHAGQSTQDVDDIAEQTVQRYGAIAAFKGLYG